MKSILIVEDHPSIRSMLVSLFAHAGYQVQEASDGALGLNLASQGGYTVILLDLKMPSLDGFSVLKALKKNPPPNPNGPIIVFSSHAYEYAQKEALAAGAASFIIKDDLDTLHLVEKVETIISDYAKTSHS